MCCISDVLCAVYVMYRVLYERYVVCCMCDVLFAVCVMCRVLYE